VQVASFCSFFLYIELDPRFREIESPVNPRVCGKSNGEFSLGSLKVISRIEMVCACETLLNWAVSGRLC
jgi:hypothetical protein